MNGTSKEINWPALNWFIHVLINNVGKNEWIKMTKEELEQRIKETGSDYPYKVISHPIPSGKKIVLKDGKTHTIKCDSEETRQLIVDMAKAYDELERKYHHGRCEERASEWRPVSELRPHSRASAFREDAHKYFVYSPELAYIGGPQIGFRRDGEWYLYIDGKEIKHKVTHFRCLPPLPNEPVMPYEKVKEEVTRIRKELGRL